MKLVVGSRGSPLALAQVAIIRGLLERAHAGVQIETKIIKTSGDQFTNLSLAAGGGKGLFTKEIEEQLRRGEIDVAVHSMKDLPTELPDGLTVGAVPAREDARDVLIAKQSGSLAALPAGARVATSSIRRRAQLLAQRPDLQVEEIRGNIETRLRKLAESATLDALILAAAGLRRLGLWRGDFRLLEIEEMIPAVGQGAIACEVREQDFATQELLAPVNDADTMTCTAAERAFLQAMGGGCQVPYAAHAQVEGTELRLVAAVFSPDGEDVRKVADRARKSEPEELGRRAASQIL